MAISCFPNARGSYGQGEAFTKGNKRDWGFGDLRDIVSSVDAVARKVSVDATRIGLPGWSYSSIFTDHAIASTTRFKAASSGAGVAAPLSLSGADQYVNEIRLAWKEGVIEKYLKLSYPFLHANRITTLTQFIVG